MTRFRSLVLNLSVLLAGIVIALVLLEFLLRIHNPFQARIKGNRIVLLTNKRYRIRNNIIPTLEPVIAVSRNALGFRGPDPPPDFDKYLTIFAVGGSTTQCFFLSDEKTWPARFGQRLRKSFRNVWVNNAGLDGHSSFGHAVLLEDIIRPKHPKVVLFLVGGNDVARAPGEEYDAENVKGGLLFSSPTAFIKSLSAYSEVAALTASIYRSANAYQHGLHHQYINLRQQGYQDIPVDRQEQYLEKYCAPAYLRGYRERLEHLISLAREGGIEPVLMTQPLLAGGGIDDVTGLDLARISVGPDRNGKMWWDVLEQYNEITRRTGRESGVPVVDIARELPKSSRNFYDFIHFSNEGAQAIAEILYRDLCLPLQQKFPRYVAGPCAQ